MNRRILIITFPCLLAMALWQVFVSGQSRVASAQAVPGLQFPVRVLRDSNYIPHIFAKNDHDAFFMLGYTHARDRFFQMDYQRRLFSGRLAEMLGKRSLDTDIRMRTYGLRRAAEASLSSYSSETRSIFSAYADGVNAYLALMRKDRSLLPSEY